LQLPPARKQLRIPDSKIETSDSISKISVAKFKIGVAVFNIFDSAMETTVGWTVTAPSPEETAGICAAPAMSRRQNSGIASAFLLGSNGRRIAGADWSLAT
jgi:hypothetical protein